MLKVFSILSIFAVSIFAMHSAELNINDKDLEIGAKFDIGQFNEKLEPDTVFMGVKFLGADKIHASDKNQSVDNNQSIDPYLEVSYLVMKDIGSKGVKVGIGMKFNYTKDYASLPLGLEFRYPIPAPKLVPMYLNAALYYAPSVLTFSDGKDFLEYRVSYDVELIEDAIITFGYRSINTNYKTTVGSFTYNSSWYFGFKVRF